MSISDYDLELLKKKDNISNYYKERMPDGRIRIQFVREVGMMTRFVGTALLGLLSGGQGMGPQYDNQPLEKYYFNTEESRKIEEEKSAEEQEDEVFKNLETESQETQNEILIENLEMLKRELESQEAEFNRKEAIAKLRKHTIYQKIAENHLNNLISESKLAEIKSDIYDETKATLSEQELKLEAEKMKEETKKKMDQYEAKLKDATEDLENKTRTFEAVKKETQEIEEKANDLGEELRKLKMSLAQRRNKLQSVENQMHSYVKEMSTF